MQVDELRILIEKNSALLYEYTNAVLLKDIGEINPIFFKKLIEDFLNKENRKTSINEVTLDTLPYYALTEILGDARQAFTFYRKDTMTLTELSKEVRVYYNYVKFTIEENSFCIDLVQTKAGVTAFEEEIIKFSKKFPMKTFIFQEFLDKN